jgi:hypothetical protein
VPCVEQGIQVCDVGIAISGATSKVNVMQEGLGRPCRTLLGGSLLLLGLDAGFTGSSCAAGRATAEVRLSGIVVAGRGRQVV